jgi:hypothetical protein
LDRGAAAMKKRCRRMKCSSRISNIHMHEGSAWRCLFNFPDSLSGVGIGGARNEKETGERKKKEKGEGKRAVAKLMGTPQYPQNFCAAPSCPVDPRIRSKLNFDGMKTKLQQRKLHRKAETVSPESAAGRNGCSCRLKEKPVFVLVTAAMTSNTGADVNCALRATGELSR